MTPKESRLAKAAKQDRQRRRVYQSTNSFRVEFEDRQFDSIKHVEEYLAFVVNSKWFAKIYPFALEIDVRDGRGSSYAYTSHDGKQFILAFPRYFRHQQYILHELAHIVCWNSEQSDHGPLFCTTLLKLVKQEMGGLAYQIYVQEFQKRNLKFDPV